MRTALIAVLLTSFAILAVPQDNTAPTASKTSDAIGAERARDDRAFERDYLREKERLFREHAGAWAAIVGGEVLQPFETMAACIEAAERKHSKALHRYVFRIGEEGDVKYLIGSPLVERQPRNIVGNSFKAALDIATSEDAGMSAKQWTRFGKVKTFQYKQPWHIEGLEVSDPCTSKAIRIPVVDSSGCNHWLALEASVANELGLSRFEIPGRAFAQLGLDRPDLDVGPFRRARVRVRVPEIDVDDTIPVVIWPR